jgi:thymidylate synthase
MKDYLDTLKYIITHGTDKSNRTGVDTRAVFGTNMQMTFDLQEGFPALTTKRLAWKSVVSELLWFLEGSSDERRLAEILYGSRDPALTTIWTANAYAPYWKPRAQFDGDLGRVYGPQWRRWNAGKYDITPDGLHIPKPVDQIAALINNLKSDPDSRRHILTAWNPSELEDAALPPCHVLSQFDVTHGELSCLLYQRSCDFFLGVPFNIASYSLLTHILAKECGLQVGKFIWTGGDCHVYHNHFDAVETQLTRLPKSLPTLHIHPDANHPAPAIKADMCV